MSKVSRITAALLLAFWVLATWHCLLEEVPGLAFLACCQHPDTAPHQDKDCEQDSCSVIESGFYKCEELAIHLPSPIWIHLFSIPAPETCGFHQPAAIELPSSAPPELGRQWQFTARAALPPRAPSLRS